MATIAGLAVAAYGAYAGSQQAKAANKPKKGYTDQTTTQTPFGNEYFSDPNGGDINNLLTRQRALIEQGPAYVGGKGSGAPGGGGGARPAPPAGQRYNAAGKLVTPKNGGGATGGGGGAAAPAGTNFNDPNSISAAVARAGLNAGNDPTTRAAQGGVQNILSGQGGADSGTGYQGYNPINDQLAQRLQGEDYGADDMIRNFITGGGNGSQGGGYDPYAPGGGGGGGGGYYGTSASSVAHDRQMVSGGGPPDTMASGGYFQEQVRHLMDQGVDNASIQAIIDAQTADITRGTQANLWGLDAQAQGTGRLGGDAWRGLANDQVRGAAGEIGRYSASTRLGARAQQQALQENLLGQVNSRDIAAMNDQTQRYGIDSASSSARAGSADSAALARRAQDLNAMGMLLQNNQFNTNQLSGLGTQLSNDQLTAIGQAPGLAGIANAGLGQANNAAGNQVALRSAQIQGGTARAALNQQAQMYNASAQQNQLNDYLRMITGIGSMGGTSHTEGTNVVAGAGYNPTAAAVTGGIGAGLAAYGAYQQGRG